MNRGNNTLAPENSLIIYAIQSKVRNGIMSSITALNISILVY